MQNNQQWKFKFNEIVQTCQDELKKTTEIGKKMLSASKTNSCLHDSLEELGMKAYQALENGTLKWEDPEVRGLVAKIKECENHLESIEKEVNKIKFYSGNEVKETKSESDKEKQD